MEISPSLLAKMLFVSFLFGIQSGIIFDIGRVLRALFFGEAKVKRLVGLYAAKLPISKRNLSRPIGKLQGFFKYTFIFLYDFFWMLYSFIALMKINYSYNDGGIRFFTVAGILLGFVIYYFTLSRALIFLGELASFAVRYTFFAIFDVVSLPFLKIYNNLVKKIKKSYEKFRIRIEKKQKKVYNVCEIVCKNTSCKDDRKRVRISVQKNQRKECAEDEKK